MKKIISLVLALTLALSLAACGNSNTTLTTEATTPATTETPTEAPTETPTDAPSKEETMAPSVTEASAALEVLQNVWAKYSEDEKFSVIGGNMEANIMGEPGAYDLAYAENMTYNLLIPAEQIENVTSVASMIHMMNANTFTCASFELADGVAAADFAAAMQEAVQNNQWMCGFPERLLIQSVDGCVTMAFGAGDLMDVFATHMAEAYAEAETLVDEEIL